MYKLYVQVQFVNKPQWLEQAPAEIPAIVAKFLVNAVKPK